MNPTTRPSRATGPAAWLAAVLLVVPLGATLGLVLPGQDAPVAAARVAASKAVQVTDNAFTPVKVTTQVGEPVTWSWTGSNPHSVAGGPWGSSHPSCSPATTVACGGQGSTFTWTPTEAGTVSYNCQVHGGMSGTVEVVAGGAEPTPSATASPSPSPSGSPTPRPDPTPTPVVSPSPSPLPTPRPTPSSSPSASATPRPTPRPSPSASPSPTPTFGPPPARETAPPVVIEPTASPSDREPAPRPVQTLEAFPDAPDLDEAIVAGEGPVALPAGADDEPASRATWVFLALGLVLGTGIALVQFVLLGPSWVGPDEGRRD